MTDQLSIVLHIENEPHLVIETNLNLKPSDIRLYAQIWKLSEDTKTYKPNELVKTYYGRYALTEAVLYLSELLQEPVAHRIRKIKP